MNAKILIVRTRLTALAGGTGAFTLLGRLSEVTAQGAWVAILGQDRAVAPGGERIKARADGTRIAGTALTAAGTPVAVRPGEAISLSRNGFGPTSPAVTPGVVCRRAITRCWRRPRDSRASRACC